MPSNRLLLSSALTVLVAACGGADPDVPITVVDHDHAAMPVPGATAVFHDDHGAVIATAVTGADGVATGTLPGGGNVTVVPPVTATDQEIVTFVDVQPGDEVHLGADQSDLPGTDEIVVSVPATTAAAMYEVTGAGLRQTFGSTPGELHVQLLAKHPSSTDVVVTVHDAPEPRFIVAKAAPLTPNAHLDLTGHPWAPATARDITLEHVPAGATGVQVWYDELATGVPVWSTGGGGSITATGAPVTVSLATPGDVGDDAITAIAYGIPGASRDGQRMSFVGRASTIDVTSSLLPQWVAGSSGTGDGVVSWKIGPGAGAPIATVLTIESDRATVAAWRVVLPADRTAFRLPALPADLTGRWPAGATLTSEGAFVSSDAPDGYRAFVTDWWAAEPTVWVMGVEHGRRAEHGPTL